MVALSQCSTNEEYMKTYKTFEEWAENQSEKQRKIVSKLRKLVADVAPRLVETSKWGNAVWVKGDLPLIYIHSKNDHIQFGFFGGALLADPQKTFSGKGKFVRHLKVETEKDIDEKSYATMIRKAVRAPAYK